MHMVCLFIVWPKGFNSLRLNGNSDSPSAVALKADPFGTTLQNG